MTKLNSKTHVDFLNPLRSKNLIPSTWVFANKPKETLGFPRPAGINTLSPWRGGGPVLTSPGAPATPSPGSWRDQNIPTVTHAFSGNGEAQIPSCRISKI